jgi:hypothetical protein
MVTLLTFAACGEDSPEEVAREYVDAVVAGDGERACELMTVQFRRETRTGDPSRPDSCGERIARFSRWLGKEGRDWLREAELAKEDTPESNWAWVQIERGDQLTLRKRDGEWKVHASLGVE